MLPLSSDDRISSVIPIGGDESVQENDHLVLLTKAGWIKKTALSAFQKISSRGLIAISLGDDDRLGWARRCTDEDDIIISTSKGYSMRFPSTDLKPTGRTSRGCRAIKLRKGDSMVDIDVLPPEPPAGPNGGRDDESGNGSRYLLAVTTLGYGKRVPAEAFKSQKRAGMGVIAIKFKSGIGDSLACMRCCFDDDEVRAFASVRVGCGELPG